MRGNLALSVIGSVLVLGLLFELLRRRHLREKYAVFWVLICALTLFVAVFPSTIFWLSGVLGVKLPANLLFFVASMVLFAVSMQHSHEIGKLEDRTRTLAEEVALLRLGMTQERSRTERKSRGSDEQARGVSESETETPRR